MACRLRTPHTARACPFGGCRTCQPVPSPSRPRKGSRERSRIQTRRAACQDAYRPCPGSVSSMTAHLERLELDDDEEQWAARAKALLPERHDQLQHGMGCALCRNHYWTQGQSGTTFLS